MFRPRRLPVDRLLVFIGVYQRRPIGFEHQQATTESERGGRPTVVIDGATTKHRNQVAALKGRLKLPEGLPVGRLVNGRNGHYRGILAGGTKTAGRQAGDATAAVRHRTAKSSLVVHPLW